MERLPAKPYTDRGYVASTGLNVCGIRSKRLMAVNRNSSSRSSQGIRRGLAYRLQKRMKTIDERSTL
jgi:hypothetical protein